MSQQPAVYAEVVRRAIVRAANHLAQRLDQETLVAVCTDVVSRPHLQQRLLARNSPRAGRLEVCWELIRQAEALRLSDVGEMRRRAQAAVAVADGLCADAGPATLIEDARGEAWACLANALRIAGELREAERAWPKAEEYVARGTGDPLLEAKLARLKGSLRLDQGRAEQAIDLYVHARSAYERLQDRSLAGRTALLIGIAQRRNGRLEEAIRSTLEAGRLLAGARESELLLLVVKNLVLYLHEAGYSEHAAQLLDRIRDLLEEHCGDLTLLRLRWLEGKIAAGLGKHVEARAALNAVRREFLARDMLYDAALVALELAALYAEAGWTFEVEKLAEEMYPVFISRDLPREASASLLLFVDAVNRRAATAEWIRKLASDLSSQRERKA
jgi:hypothetical protein